MKVWTPIIIAFVCFLTLDRLLFGFLQWELPNEVPFDKNYYFQYEYEMRHNEGLAREPHSVRILAVGTSLAYYSLDRKILESTLSRDLERPVKLFFMSQPGLTSLDLNQQKERILDLEPDLVIYPANMVDFRLHRTYVLDPNSSNEIVSDQDLILDALNFQEALQSKVSYPCQAASEFWPELPFGKTFQYLAACFSSAYRYREIFFENWELLYNHRFGRNTSYHGYMGVSKGEIDHLGWSGKSWHFEPISYMSRKGFYVEVVDPILVDGPLEVQFRNSAGRTQKYRFVDSGWKKILLDSGFVEDGLQVEAKLSQIWQPTDASGFLHSYSRMEKGVRLQQNFGLLEPPVSSLYQLEATREDYRINEFKEKEYIEDFRFRFEYKANERPELGFLNALANTKRRISQEKFRPTLFFRSCEAWVNFLKENNIPVLIINNPENPISLRWYYPSVWYSGYLDWLKSLEGSGVFVYDWKDSLEMQFFSDFHHFTAFGRQRMQNRYADLIKKGLRPSLSNKD